MGYLTETQLREAANHYTTKTRTFSKHGVQDSIQETTIFLSHSHFDKDLVKGFIQKLEDLGLKVYVDWNDSEMPKVTNRETAEKIKTKIKENDLFIILATENALNSKWVPWEVGIADQSKKTSQIILVPVVKTGNTFKGNEYLQLYNEVEFGKTENLAVFCPNQDQGILFESVVKNRGYIKG